MSTETRRILPIVLALMAGCATAGLESDLALVEALVKDRAGLELARQEAADWQETLPEVRRLLGEPLTVETAVRVALLNNRRLRAELLGLGVTRGELIQASLLPDPHFDAEVRFHEDGTMPPGAELEAGIELTRILLAGARADVAKAKHEARRIRVAGEVLDLAYQVRVATYRVQAAAAELELMATALKAFAASYDTARALHEAHNLTDLDLVTEQVAYETARAAVAESEAELVERREALTVDLGLHGEDTGWALAGRLGPPAEAPADMEGLERRALEASLDLAETKSELAAAARQLGLTVLEGWLPDLSVGLAAEHEGGSAGWTVGFAISGSLPLFDFKAGETVSRRAELRALRERYLGMAVEVRAAARSIRAKLTAAEARARQYHDVVLPLHARRVTETVKDYNAMQAGVFQVLQARRDQIDAGRAYVDTLRAYWEARASVEQLLAGRLPEMAGGSSGAASGELGMPSRAGRH
jgi:outer membrane protein TolC